MVMVPSLEMSLWVFVWDEREFARMRFWVVPLDMLLFLFSIERWRFFSLVMVLFPRQTFVSCRKGKYSMMIA
jgi:hypothetical protein